MASSQLHDSTAPQVLADQYDTLHSQFRWLVPDDFNIARVCCTRWAEEDTQRPQVLHRVAIREHVSGQNSAQSKTYTYVELYQAANRLSNLLIKLGVKRGDVVAIVLPQRFETAVAYLAVLQMGAVAMPLSILFGPEALQYRLQDSDCVLAICDESSADSLQTVRASCPLLRKVLGVGIADNSVDLELNSALAGESIAYTAIKNKAKSTTKVKDEGAILIYTSGTTGPPKGALIPHRALLGNLSGFVCSQNWFGFDGAGNKESNAVFWSPADWAWTGGLMDALLPTLYFGREIIAFRGRFSPEAAFELMQTQGVTHTFLFPTALKAMMKAYPEPHKHFKLKLQAIMSAGEAVGDAVFDYCQSQLGVTVNEMFGQTEINYIVGNCARYWRAIAGSMGKPYPGHRVAVIDDEGQECAIGVSGDVAVNRFDIHGDPDPIFFLGYWKNEASTRSKFTGDWCRTGDLASRDADGYLWYQGRADDVFKAAGYRIGPSEIENCLVKHPAVANAAIVPKPDAERGAVVKAYVVLAAGYAEKYAINLIAVQAINTPARALKSIENEGFSENTLISELQAHVKALLAPYEYPKEIEFIGALPMTTTGKVQRRVLRLQEEQRAKAKEGAS